MSKNVFDELAQALEVLPNIGPVSARRMAFYLLQHQREDAVHLIHCCVEYAINLFKIFTAM